MLNRPVPTDGFVIKIVLCLLRASEMFLDKKHEY